jgi:hypothetical protein
MRTWCCDEKVVKLKLIFTTFYTNMDTPKVKLIQHSDSTSVIDALLINLGEISKPHLPDEVRNDIVNFPYDTYVYEHLGVKFEIGRSSLSGNYCAYMNMDEEKLSVHQNMTGGNGEWPGWDYAHAGQVYLACYYMKSPFSKMGTFITHGMVLKECEDMVEAILHGDKHVELKDLA